MSTVDILLAPTLALIVAGILVYLVTVFDRERYIKLSCRRQITWAALATMGILIIVLGYHGIILLAPLPAAGGLLALAIVILIILIIILLMLQQLIPYLNNLRRTQKVLNALNRILQILSGQSSLSIADLQNLLNQFNQGNVAQLTDAQLIEIAKILNELAEDPDVGWNPTDLWTWLENSGLSDRMREIFGTLLEKINTLLESEDLSDEDRQALERLRDRIQELQEVAGHD